MQSVQLHTRRWDLCTKHFPALSFPSWVPVHPFHVELEGSEFLAAQSNHNITPYEMDAQGFLVTILATNLAESHQIEVDSGYAREAKSGLCQTFSQLICKPIHMSSLITLFRE